MYPSVTDRHAKRLGGLGKLTGNVELLCGWIINDVPLDWIERLSDSPNCLRRFAETVCEHFAYKIDGRGRPRDIPVEEYADRLAQVYGGLTGRAITYAKATDTSPSRRAGEPYGSGLDFMLAGLRLIDPRSTSFQAAAQIDRLRTARRGTTPGENHVCR